MIRDRQMAGTECFDIHVLSGKSWAKAPTDVIREIPLEVFLNERHVVTISCTGNDVEELAVGFLRSEGILSSAGEIKGIEVSGAGTAVHVLTSDPPGQAARLEGKRTIASSGARSGIPYHSPHQRQPLQSALMVSPPQIFALMDSLIQSCRLHDLTGGTHGAALADAAGIIVTREDIGRHNAIDMLGGYALLKDIDCSDKIVVRTGRVSAEIVHKIAALAIPVVISISVPTALAIRLARDAGITLVGAVRGGKMKIYTHEKRIGL